MYTIVTYVYTYDTYVLHDVCDSPWRYITFKYSDLNKENMISVGELF